MPVLDWIGKKAIVNHHREVPYRLLNCDKSKSFGSSDAGNLLVQGDNLEALKALLPYYAGKIDCIYIDPPYNTGNESWIYNDNVDSPEIRAWLGRAVGKKSEDLSRHDKWLCMMYPRLRLLTEFLTDEGVLLCSIDDNEAAHVRMLLDDIMGSQNFIAQLVWEKGRKNDAKLFSVGHEYMFVYAKRLSNITEKDTIWRSAKDGIAEIAAEYHRLRELSPGDYDLITKGMADFYKALPKGHPSKAYARSKNADERGIWRDNNISWHGGGGPKYEIIHPVTLQPCAIPDDGWRFVEESMKKKIADGYVVFRRDHKKPPIYKSYLYTLDDSVVSEPGDAEDEVDINEGKKEVLASVFYRHSQPSIDVQKEIFGAKVFPNPKDHEVLARLIRYVTSDRRDCLVMDSFAGSASTGHAVFDLNKSDRGQRRFVLIEMDKAVSEKVTRPRLEAVFRSDATTTSNANGFRFCTLGEALFHSDGGVNPTVTFPDLAAHVFFCETGSPIPRRADGSTSLIGTFRGRAIYLLHASDSSRVPSSTAGNVLTVTQLESLPISEERFSGPRVVYAEGCTIPDDRLNALGITFKQIPYQIEGL